jgi:RecB family exonuclease
MHALWSLEHWADAIAELPTSGELPTRIALVPNLRVAHELRCQLLETKRADALIGTRFVTLLQLASQILLEAGEPHQPNDRELGPAFAREAFSHTHFKDFVRQDLQQLPGWDVAFTRTVSDLDAALLSPNACLGSNDPHIADVGRIHDALRHRSDLRTIGDVLARAAKHAATYSDHAPTLAVVTGFESPAELALLRALPEVTLAAWLVRPHRGVYAERFEALFGEQAPVLDPEALLGQRSRSALEHVQRRLFEDVEPTPAPPDDSVSIALYAGVHEEIEAAASWVVREILEHAVAARDIALLTPTAEPYGSLLRARIAAISSHPALDIFSERGIPLSELADGARLLIVLRALQAGLTRESMAPLLPLLRADDAHHRVRGLSRAWELLNTVAGIGGRDATPSWTDAWTATIARLGSAPAPGTEERELQRRAQLHDVLCSLQPAVTTLSAVLVAVHNDEPLHLLWSRLEGFLDAHVMLPPSVPPAAATLGQACLQFQGHQAHEPAGASALDWLEDNLHKITARSARFGEPAIYIGTLAGVRGLRFGSVRILGLAEGSVPSATREDPVLPDAARQQLSAFLLGSRQRAHRQLTTFDDAIRCARARLSLTAPRVSIEGSVRQPASVLLDVVRALSGSDQGLETELGIAASRGRAYEREARSRLLLSHSARLDRIAQRDQHAARRDEDPALSFDALRRIRDRSQPSEQDGILFGLLPYEKLPGLGPDRPISPSRLKTLLECPHRFLYENILGFRQPETALQSHLLDVMRFGTWLHGIAEEFWNHHGAALAARELDPSQARAQLLALARERFATLQQTYPFASQLVAQTELAAMCDQLNKLLQLNGPRDKAQRFVAVERMFGYAGECDIATDAGPLYIRGKIDKLDCVGDTLVIRDIKTGSGKPRRAKDPPHPNIDLQLAVYALVAKRMAEAWGTPNKVAVAYMFLRSGDSDRSWWGADYEVLEREAKFWLATAKEVLEKAAFARSPVADDCRYCAFKPVCAHEMQLAAAALADERVPKRLQLLKLPEQP